MTNKLLYAFHILGIVTSLMAAGVAIYLGNSCSWQIASACWASTSLINFINVKKQ